MNRELANRITFTLLRVISGLIFAEIGCTKVFGWFGGTPGGMPPLVSQLDFGGMIEVAGGCLIALGLFTRPVAFILAGEMAVAYWQFHAPVSPWPSRSGGVQAILYCFMFLYFAAQGAGEWSVDAWDAKRMKAKRAAREARTA